jgi:hypothetical protein
MKSHYIIGSFTISGTTVPEISTKIQPTDILGSVMVRWGINRDNYKVDPGLYAVGNPESSSDVFVTANYKLSFDSLRKNLDGINGWILVLDTKGVNVWCAAGKGTFGTKELVNRIRSVSLEKVISHRRLILPQLGAVGVSAHQVKEDTGFNIHYGPVRAADIRKFIDSGYRADKEMRKVKFGLWDRVKLIPVELVYGKYYLLGALVIISLLSCIGIREISLNNVWVTINPAIVNLLTAYIAGIIITPVLLPYIPARRFSIKGLIIGAMVAIILLLSKAAGENLFEMISWLFLISSISSFLAMNFTGSSTFTSLSGVKKEMKVAIPLQIALSAIGIILLVIGKLLKYWL